MINMDAIPKFDIRSDIKSDIKFEITTKLTTWIGHLSCLRTLPAEMFGGSACFMKEMTPCFKFATSHKNISPSIPTWLFNAFFIRMNP